MRGCCLRLRWWGSCLDERASLRESGFIAVSGESKSVWMRMALERLHVKHSFTWWISCEALSTCYTMAV